VQRAEGSVKRARARRLGTVPQIAPRDVVNRLPPVGLLDEGAIGRIHDASMTILEEIGINVLLPEARAIMARAGAEPGEDARMRFDRGLVADLVALAPSSFVLRARNPSNARTIGDGHMVFATLGGAPNVTDLDRGRRPGTFADYCDVMRLAQSLNACHMVAGSPVEPQDIPVEVRHLHSVHAILTLTDKPACCTATSPRRLRDAMEMVRIALGEDRESFERSPGLWTVINTNSPLQLDRPMLAGIIEMARANQMSVITPFTLAGAMAPVTLPGALALQNAEALAAIAFSQMVRPGAPVVYGGFTSNVDMRSGAPAFGTPEYVQAAQIGGQLARRYRLPYRSSSTNASNAPDEQATYESAMSLWATLTGGANLVMHAFGWLEGGLTASFEKIIIDAEMVQTLMRALVPPQVDDATLALDAIREVGPGGHFFGAAHTMARYETAFYQPLLSDWRTFQQWSADGAAPASRRANRVWKRLLADYEAPPLDPGVREALDEFVARREREGGAPNED